MVLIKEAMTIDLLSEGRLELGLGAGWLAEEYAAIGLTMDSPGERIDRLEHVVQAAKAYTRDAPLEIDNANIAWREFELRRERYGISYITVNDQTMEDFAPVVSKLAGR